MIDGIAHLTAGRNGAGSQFAVSTVDATVEISAAPMTLLPNSSGC